jgi:superfamily I DNA/RNA helicase
MLRVFCKKIDFLNEQAADLATRAEDLAGICTILDDYDEIYGDYQLSARITGLLRFLGTQASQEYKYHNFREGASGEDAVQLMTVHKSKGLEFHTVFLPRLNHREFPVSKMGGKKYYHVLGGVFEENKAKYDSDTEDERKLFYVAITRAKQNLFMSYTLENQPVSEFVSDAAESASLKMNREDLQYQAEKRLSPEERKRLREEAQFEREMLRQLVDQAREALHDYYGTGNHFCPGIIMEYKTVCRQGPEAILEEAQRLGLI